MTQPDVEILDGSQAETAEALIDPVACIEEIGQITLKRGEYSEKKHILSRQVVLKKELTLPPENDFTRTAEAAYVTYEFDRQTGITVTLSGPSPSHYLEPTTTHASLFLYPRAGQSPRLTVIANRFFYHEANLFEKPLPPQNVFDKAEQRSDWRLTRFVRAEGNDFVVVQGPTELLGENTLAFAGRFANESLEFFRRFDASVHASSDETQSDKGVAGSVTLFLSSGLSPVAEGDTSSQYIPGASVSR